MQWVIRGIFQKRIDCIISYPSEQLPYPIYLWMSYKKMNIIGTLI